MSDSRRRAQAYFESRSLDPGDFTIGHLTDELARLYARDLYLIGYTDESEILSSNDVSRYTAILDLVSGKACGVFFDIPHQPEIQANSNASRRAVTTQISH